MKKRRTSYLSGYWGASRILPLLFCLLTATACVNAPPQLTVEGPYASLSPMFFGVGSVFMNIRNTGGGDALLAASVNLPSATVELHDVKDGKMVKVDRIKIAARDTTELKPRSLHIMIFNMPKDLKEGSELLVTLTFERSGQKQVAVRFEKPGESPMQSGH